MGQSEKQHKELPSPRPGWNVFVSEISHLFTCAMIRVSTENDQWKNETNRICELFQSSALSVVVAATKGGDTIEVRSLNQDVEINNSKGVAMTWPETIHCKSRLHCVACRTDPRWRESTEKVFGPIECPLQLPIDHDGPWPEVSAIDVKQGKKEGCAGCGGRKSCMECVEKHLGAAAVLIGEVADGYDEHRLRAIGHLHEAADESREWPELHEAIRAARRTYQIKGIQPDFSELAALAAHVIDIEESTAEQ